MGRSSGDEAEFSIEYSTNGEVSAELSNLHKNNRVGKGFDGLNLPVNQGRISQKNKVSY